MPREFKNLVGLKFGRLTVVSRSENSKQDKRRWICECICGNTTTIPTGDLNSGKTKSCGCLVIETTIKKNIKHNHSKNNEESNTYYSWKHMKQRCLNKNNSHYFNYGGRGISICDKWIEFTGFLEDMGICPEGYSIERINVNGNYEASNCKWIPKNHQSRNTRRSVLTEELVIKIRKDRELGMKRSKLMEKYNLSTSMVDSVIYSSKSWRN